VEDRSWAKNAANNVDLDQVLFEKFHRMNVTGWFIDMEGSSFHGYNDVPKDNENIDNENVDKGPGDDSKENANTDDNIDNARGNHNIPDELPGSLPTNPTPQPAEPKMLGLGTHIQ
jgi:hypothetical protein